MGDWAGAFSSLSGARALLGAAADPPAPGRRPAPQAGAENAPPEPARGGLRGPRAGAPGLCPNGGHGRLGRPGLLP